MSAFKTTNSFIEFLRIHFVVIALLFFIIDERKLLTLNNKKHFPINQINNNQKKCAKCVLSLKVNV